MEKGFFRSLKNQKYQQSFAQVQHLNLVALLILLELVSFTKNVTSYSTIPQKFKRKINWISDACSQDKNTKNAQCFTVNIRQNAIKMNLIMHFSHYNDLYYIILFSSFLLHTIIGLITVLNSLLMFLSSNMTVFSKPIFFIALALI